MTEQVLNGHRRADEVPVQTKPLEFDPYTPPLSPDTPPDAVPKQDPQPAAELDVDDEQAAADAEAGPAAEQAEARRFHRVRTVAEHPATRAAARHAWHVGDGARLAVRHRRDEKSTARHHRMMAAAEAKGDHATVALWEEKAAKHRAERHARRMELIRSGPHAVKTGAYITAASAGVLLLIGVCLAVADKDPHEVDAPLMTAVNVIRTVITLASILWAPAVLVAMFAGVVALWSKSRRHAVPPAWLAPAGTVTASAAVTPSSLVVALRELGLADLKAKIKAMGDNGAMMLSLIRVAGCGVEVDVTLPEGTSTLEIQNRRRKLAENLGRHEHEVFITIPPAARTVRVWIADSGALDDPIGPSALVTDATLRASVYTGRAPWGQDLRGDQIALSLFQRHILLTGASNQGKTAALRALMLWAALDPAVEFWMADLKGVGDWRPFDGIATTLIQGPTDAHVEAACDMIDRGVTEMENRLMALEKTGSDEGVTQAMAYKPGSGFHPLMIVVDESQVAFVCPAKDAAGNQLGGVKATSRFFQGCRKLLNQGRAVNVHLVLGTQDPTDQNLPKIIREAFHIRGALFLGTESQAVMALGETVVEAGAAPHKLRMGIDKGMLVLSAGDAVALPSGQSFVTVRTNYISGKDAVAIADRAKALRKPVATRTGNQDDRPELDVLADVAAVLNGAVRMPKNEVMHLLAERDDRYRTWTDAQLKAALDQEGAPQYTSNGKTTISGDKIREALARRFSATE